MTRRSATILRRFLAAGLLLAVAPLDGAQAGFAVLHAFDGSDGANPIGGLLVDGTGNLFGIASAGGAHDRGTVFEVAPDGSTRVLYDFTGGSDGGSPWGRLIADGSGNLYGTTSAGGAGSCGPLFKLTPDGVKSTMKNMRSAVGISPDSGMAADASGNLYGTTVNGGGSSSCVAGCGVVFKIAR